jgi:peroxiredoxin
MFKPTKILPLILSFFLLLNACSSERTESASEQSPDKNESGLTKAPDFEVTTIDGKKISLKQSMEENKPLVVYFTASWCPDCAKNWPAISEVYPEYQDKLNLVAIGVDPTDDEEVMRKLSEEKGFTFPITKGHPDIMVDFGVRSQATTVGINRDGYIAFQKKAVLSAEEYRSLFDELVH